MALHPDVAVVLSHASLRVQEWQADAAFSTQAGIVAAALLNCLLIELVAQPARRNVYFKLSNTFFHIYFQKYASIKENVHLKNWSRQNVPLMTNV